MNASELRKLVKTTLPPQSDFWALPFTENDTCVGGLMFGCTRRGSGYLCNVEQHRRRLEEIQNLIQIEYRGLRAADRERQKILALEKQGQELKRLVEQLHETLLISSHQMRRPLVNVESIITLIRDNLEDVDREKLSRIIEISLIGVHHAAIQAGGIAKILAYEDTRKFDLKPVEIDTYQELHGLARVLRTASQREDVDIEFMGRSPHIMMDRESFLFVFYNLLDNALKYAESGTRITLASEKERRTRRFALKVKSRGASILPGDIEHVFEKFWREPNANGHHSTGLGVGCWAAREHMRAQGGELELEVDGNLSIFIVYEPGSWLQS
jgi:K+-sensing histidine kinase KdpD